MPYALEPPENFLQILQRIWWRLDRALDEESIRASALVGGMEALLSGTTTLVDHHASPNAIDGSLDVIADALGSLGVRSVLCYETSDRDGAERAAAGIAENRRFLERVRASSRRSRAAWSARTPPSRSPTRRCCACAEVGPLHVHAAEDAVDRGAVARLAAARRRSTSTRCSPTASTSATTSSSSSAARARRVAHNARSNMNNAVGRAPVARARRRTSRSARTGSAPTCSRSRARRTSACARTTSARGADWPLARLAESARLAGRIFGEPLLGTLEPGAPADLVVLDYAAARAARRRAASPATGSSASRRGTCAT